MKLKGETLGALSRREEASQGALARQERPLIADELVVSYRTVETHVSTILSKLAFSSRAQVAAGAVEIGLVKLSE